MGENGGVLGRRTSGLESSDRFADTLDGAGAV
jgi:hypothetical protein